MMCETYPNMKLVLCHSARGFNMHHVIDSIEQLIGLDNLYFDTVSGRALFSRALVRALRLGLAGQGAVTEAGATNALIRAFGPQKVMYGSDWPVAESRGKCISLGDSFIWLTPDNVDLFARCALEPLAQSQPSRSFCFSSDPAAVAVRRRGGGHREPGACRIRDAPGAEAGLR